MWYSAMRNTTSLDHSGITSGFSATTDTNIRDNGYHSGNEDCDLNQYAAVLALVVLMVLMVVIVTAVAMLKATITVVGMKTMTKTTITMIIASGLR